MDEYIVIAKDKFKPDLLNTLDLAEQIIDNTYPDRLYDIYELNRQFHKLLLILTPREERVIRMYFWENKTLKEIGDDFCVTPERIKCILLKAYRKCKHPSRAKLIKDFTMIEL